MGDNAKMHDDRGDRDQQRTSGLGAQAVTYGLAAAAGARLGGALGAAASASASPYLLALIDKVRDEWQVDQRGNIAAMTEAAAAAAGYDADELGEQMGRSPRTRLLTATAAESAAKSAWPPKIIALGKVLAAGLIADDGVEIDIAQFALAAMANMERPHVVLLDLLVNQIIVSIEQDLQRGYRKYAVKWRPVAEIDPTDLAADWGYPEWTEEEILFARPQLRPAMATVMSYVRLHGLVSQGEREGTLQASSLGRQVVGYYVEAGGELP